MTPQEMKKLSRSDLLELLLTQGKENEDLRARLQAAEQQLADRRVKVESAGTLAEALVSLNGMMEAAQKTADEYLENLRLHEEERRSRADGLVREAEEKAAAMEKAAAERCAAMEAEAKAQSARYWDEVSEKMEAFYQAHQGLKELLSVVNKQD